MSDPNAPAATATDTAKPAVDPAAAALFPNDKPADDAPKLVGDKPADPKAVDPAKIADATKADWKEYVPDATKSEAENATAKAEHDKTKPAAVDVSDKVPEDGKYALKMPEGVEVDQELVDALGPQFKELGLTNKQAQALADKFTATMQARGAKQQETWANTVTGWVDQAKADKEIGGAKWDGTVKDAQRAINKFGSPELKSYLEASGGGNHPEVIRAFAKVGAAIKEDSPPAGGADTTAKPADAAHILFPNDKPKG